MDKQELSREQEEYKQEQLAAGMAFEEFMNTVAYTNLKNYYEEQIRAFTNAILVQDDRNINEFEPARRELIGLRKMFSRINSAVEALKNERTRPTGE